MLVRDGLRRRPAFRLPADGLPGGPELVRLRDDEGVTEVEVVGSVRLDERDPSGLTSWLAWLRDAASALVAVRWTGQVILAPSLISNIVHLPPPESAGAATRPWLDLHAKSALYYRRGPGFITVKDLRRSRQRMNITLDDPAELDLFERIARPVEVGTLTRFEGQLDEFLDAGLAYRVGNLVVGIATHLRRWPIPHTAV
jgi:uncharacterized protein DUF5825